MRFHRPALAPTIALTLLLLMQLGLFAVAAHLRHHRWLYADNFFYDVPAWNLASGHGFSIERSVFDDPYLRDAYSARQPGADSAYTPATTLPPGYGLFLAGLYAVVGHRHAAAIVVNALLLLVHVVCFFILLRRRSWGCSSAVSIALAAMYPAWAFWSSSIMSDMLHTALMSVFAVVFTSSKQTLSRNIAAGLLLGAAALVRPYVVLFPVALVAWWAFVNRTPLFTPRRLATVAVCCWLVVGSWTVRNAVVFGKLIPVTSMGLGAVLWEATFQGPFFEDVANTPEFQAAALEVTKSGIVDGHYHDDNRRLQQLALERIEADKLGYAVGCIKRVARLWISSFAAGVPRAVLVGFIVVQIITLFALVVGLWQQRRSADPVLALAVPLVIYYWAVFIPFGVEARLTAPARGFAFIVVGAVLGPVLQAAIKRRDERRLNVE